MKDFIEATSDVPAAAKKKGADEAPEYVHKDIFAVGDFWHWNTEYLNGYIKATDNEASMFDVPLHFNFHDASVADGEYNMADLLKGSLMMSNPEKAVTFVDNHESQVGGVLESYVEDWFKPLAYAVILLREQGYPCLFTSRQPSGSWTTREYHRLR